MNKHAYLFTVNSNFDVFNTCLRLLDFESNDFYIMFDKKSFPTIESAKVAIEYPKNAIVRHMSIKTINLGGYSQVDSVLSLIQEVIRSGEKYSYLHFLQNSDLPIKTNKEILNYFETNNGKEFVNIEWESDVWAERCCKYRYVFSHNRFYRTNRILNVANIALARLQELVGIECNAGIKFYYGSALFSITLPFAKYIDSKRHSIRKIFRWTLAPDEKFIQTILMNSPFAGNLVKKSNKNSSNAMLIDWGRERQKNSPHVWRMSEYDYLMSRPENGCYARKFMASVDMDIVRAIERRLLKP